MHATVDTFALSKNHSLHKHASFHDRPTAARGLGGGGTRTAPAAGGARWPEVPVRVLCITTVTAPDPARLAGQNTPVQRTVLRYRLLLARAGHGEQARSDNFTQGERRNASVPAQ